VPALSAALPVPDGREAPPQQVRQGQVVEFRVRSAREGALAVHGLTDVIRVRAGQDVVVRFKALYGGRFPLHFHGPDLSHFEVAVLEVRG
jgi:hypothetical protein